MDYELTIMDMSEEDTKEHEKKYGSFNDAPPNFVEISEEEFSQSMFFTYSPNHIEYRQVLNDPDENRKECLSVTLYYFFDGNGFGIAQDYWAKKIRFFKFTLCEHDYKELTVKEARNKGIYHGGSCYHVLECESCSFITSYDSSG